jgi:mxaJ protein
MPAIKTLTPLLALAAAFAVTATKVEAADPGGALRVCADPNNLPFSNRHLEGFENKLAELIAAEFDTTLQYTWMPQRRGFIKNTLGAHECDVVMGVPSDYDLVLTTKPYYRSTYVFAYAKGKGMALHTFDDPVLRQLKIGLQEVGSDGSNPPPAHALARRGIVGNVVGYKMWNVDSVSNPAGAIIEAVATGDIDVAIVWGPLAGYYAKQQPVELDLVAVSPAFDEPSIPFVYDISIGVRRGDAALRDRLESVLERRHADIEKLLESYGVPLVAGARPALRPQAAGDHG